ncbi:hypothetical protein Dimus_024502, partial [Dionaea muscipula]
FAKFIISNGFGSIEVTTMEILWWCSSSIAMELLEFDCDGVTRFLHHRVAPRFRLRWWWCSSFSSISTAMVVVLEFLLLDFDCIEFLFLDFNCDGGGGRVPPP